MALSRKGRAALEYGAAGYEVFPCDGKRPLTKNGFKDATTDAETIEGWWSDWPDANIATASASILDLDVPRREGDADGRENWTLLLRQHKDADGYPRVVTGGVYDGQQGEQRWFAPGAPAGHVAPGVDMRGEGNYAMMPPSKTDRPYKGTLPSLAELPEVPSWLLDEQAAYRALPSSEKNGGRHDAIRDFIFAINQEDMRRSFAVRKATEWARANFDDLEYKRRDVDGEIERMCAKLEWPLEVDDNPWGDMDISKAKPKTDSDDELPYRTSAWVAEHAPPEPVWFWENYLASGDHLVLSGIPKVGKTTFLFGLLETLQTGEQFCGLATRQVTSLILSEQGITHARNRVSDTTAYGWLLRHEVRGRSWPEIATGAIELCRKYEHGVLVVDSFARWAQLEEGQENDASSVLRALAPLDLAKKYGIAVILVHHNRKDGGSHGTGLRGSGALAGNVDTILSMDRVSGRARGRFLEVDSWHEQSRDIKVERQPDGTFQRIDLVDADGDEPTPPSWGSSARLPYRDGDEDWGSYAQ